MIEEKQLKATLLHVAREHAGRGSIPQERDTLWEAAGKLDISTDANATDKSDQQRLLLAWNDLFRTGHLCWGYSLGDPNPPFYHVTVRGEVALQKLSRDPANPEGYMAYLHEQGELDPVAGSYIQEALQTYEMACYKAAVVLVGGATERLSLLVRDALVSMTGELGEAASSLRKERNIKGILDAIEQLLRSWTQRKAYPSMPYPLSEHFSSYWPAIPGHIRMVRNEVGHPQSIDPVTQEVAHAALLLFPMHVKLVLDLIAWIQGISEQDRPASS